MKRLLMIAERYPPALGGVAASAGRISQAIGQIGYDVDVFVFARELPSGAVRSEDVLANLRVHRFGPARNVDFSCQQSLTFLDWLHQRRGFHAVWGHYATLAGFLATWFGRTHGIPSIVSVRGNDLDRELFPPGDIGRLHWCLSNCDGIVAVSQDLANKVRVLCGRTAAVLPNSVDAEIFSPGPRDEELLARYGIQRGELVLGFCGELRAKKGMSFLITALSEIAAAQPSRLLVIGEIRATDRGEFERTMTGNEVVRSNMIVTGHISEPAEVARHLRLVDVMLIPSLWDGMPNSLLESMATGIPVIASDAGAIPEVITDGRTGMLIPRTDLHLMSERIHELLAMPGQSRRELIERARKHVLEHHSLEAERQRLRTLLSELA